MRVGVVIMAVPQPEVASTARWAEEVGFDYVASGEHLFFNVPTPNAFITLAAAAGATQRIRLLSTLTLLPLYPPALAAKLIASIDDVSGGRFDLGVGVGGEFPVEFDAVGVPVKERGRRTDESLDLITTFLSGRPVTGQGWWGSAENLTLRPSAVQQPHPPIWLGGRKEAAFRRAGRFANHWLPYLYTPEQMSDSLAKVNQYAADFGRTDRVDGAIFCWGAVDRDGAVARRAAIDTVSATYKQDFEPLASRYLVFGTPQQVIDRLLEYRDAGAQTVIFSSPPGEQFRTNATLLAEEVLPALREGTHD